MVSLDKLNIVSSTCLPLQVRQKSFRILHVTFASIVSSVATGRGSGAFLPCGMYATHGIAVAIPSVRLSVRRVYCDKTKPLNEDILILHETAITLAF